MAAENPIDFNKYIGGEEALKTAARSVRSLKNDVTALSKSVDDDAGRIKSGFDKIAAAIRELQANGGKLTLTSDADKKLLQDYIKQVGDLKRAKEELKETERAQASLQKGLSDATRQYTSELARQKEALKAATLAGDAEGQRKAAAAIRQTAQETAQLSKALRGANSEFTAAKGSYDALVIENNKLLASLHALEGGLNSGSQEAKKLKQQIFDNTETLKLFDTETNRSFRNVGNYAQSFSGLIAELAKARAAQAGLAEGSQAYINQQMRISGFQTAAQKSAANMGLSYEQAEAKIAGATAAIQPLVTGLVRLEKEQEAVALSTGKESEAYRKIGFQIASTKKQIDTVAVATTEATEKSSAFTAQLAFNRAGLTQFAAGLVAGAVGFQAILAGVQAVFQANVVLSDSLADVRKTAGLTADEADRLVGSLKQLDTPTSLAGLLDIAKVGGQLGIAKADILDFTKAVDVANQALGDDFAGGAEQIATEMGKIAGVFRKELGPDVAQNLLAIGSAVNEIGAVGPATAPFLTDVALRVGAVSSQAGAGLKNVLAYAAVLQETGFSAETSGTALNRFFSVLSTRTEAAYRIAQKANPALTLKEFTNLVNTDFNQAIQVFLKGLNAGGKTTTELSGLLSTLKLQSGEAKNVIITLAQNTDLFAERQKTANAQLRDATSLAAEAAIKTDTLAGSVDRTTNSMSNLFTSGAGGRFLKFLVDMVRVNIDDFAKDFENIGKGIDYIKNKFTGATKPQEDFAKATGETIKTIEKQAGANQQLLDSYTALGAVANRTEAQRLQLAQTRAKLITRFGTDEVAVIQAGINKQLQAAESHKQVLRQDLANYDKSTAELLSKQAVFQEALNKQEAGLSAQQIARVKEAAQARLDVERRTGAPFKLAGKSTNPELEAAIGANLQLLRTEQALTTQQGTRKQILDALAKVQPVVTKGTVDQTGADKDAADSEETLDRAGKERAKNRKQRLEDELADNRRGIDAVKQYQAEQGKLFEDKQITEQLFAESVAGSEDLITQLVRDGAALRIRIARAESREKLIEADNDRIRQRSKKDITQAELTDIEAQYSERRIAIYRAEKRKIETIKRETAEALETKPLEFISPLNTKSLQKELDKSGKAIKRAIDNSEEQLDDAAKRQQKRLDDEVKRVADAEQRKRDLRERGFEVGAALGNAYFEYQAGQLDAQAAAEQASFDRGIKNAGENNELKAALEAEHQRKQAVLRRKQAENERSQALFSILINTAQAVMQDLGRYGLPFALPFIAADVALGGIQAAMVASRPIPAFFKGRRGGEAVPFATVAEKGPELVHEKATGKFRYHVRPTLTSLGRGDDVYTAEETRQALAAAANDRNALQHPLTYGRSLADATAAIQSGRVQVVDNAKQLGAIEKAMHANTAAMKGLKQVTLNVNGEVTGAMVQRGNSLVRSLNQRLLNYGS
jgi:TP901 family phage tail tape measure protein